MNDSGRHAKPPAVGVDQVMWALLHAAHTVEDRLEAALATVQLSGAKLGVLTELVKAGEPLPLSELASRIQCVRSNVTQLVDRLEAEGLVRRVNDPSDRRSKRAELTASGRERQRAGAEKLTTIQKELAASIPSGERAPLLHALAGLK
jgi:DNA-binding MarR family transcriptional regulator